MADKDTKTADEKLDAIGAHLDSMHKRMDAWDEEKKSDRARLDAACEYMDQAKADRAKADAEEKEKADKAKVDAAEAEEKAKKDAAEKEEKEKADKAKADAAAEEEKKKADAARATDPALQARIAALETQLLGLPAHGSGDDRKPYIDAQVKAERVYQAFGDSAGAPPALRGESVDGYQRRLMSKFKEHSKNWKDKDLIKLDASMLCIAEEQIYADAMTAIMSPASVPVGTLRKHVDTDATGRQITSFTGDPEACWGQFKAPKQVMTGMDMHKKLN